MSFNLRDPTLQSITLCSPVSESANRGHIRSAARGDLAVPRSRTNN